MQVTAHGVFLEPHFAQTLNEAKAVETTLLSKESLFNGSLPGVALDAQESQAFRHSIFVDNEGIIGLDPGFAGSTQVDLASRFNAAGLRV